MVYVATVAPIILAGILLFSAIRKLSGKPEVVQDYVRLGVPEARLGILAGLLLAGAAGLIIGFWWKPIGIAAACGVVLYFLFAIVVHLRAHDSRGMSTPLAIALFAGLVLGLQLIAT